MPKTPTIEHMPPTLDVPVCTSTLSAPPDYADTIRTEIERDVMTLIEDVEWRIKGGWNRDDGWNWDPKDGPVLSLSIGYLVATHRGRDIIRTGDIMCGLLVTVSRDYPRTIEVCTNEIKAWREGWFDENGDRREGETTWLSTSKSVQW